MRQKYTVDFVQVTQTVLNITAGYNSITFINKGAAIVFVENFPLAQNESISIDGNANEECSKPINIKGNTLGALWLIKKTFV